MIFRAKTIADVDVAVAGGTTFGIDAAVAAAKNGSKVMLVAPRQALGEDVAGTLRIELPDGGVSTPLSIRRSLDRALLEAGVGFRCWTQPMDILADDRGNVTGLLVAGRDGFAIVKAKEVVDATPYAMLARRAGVLPPLTGGKYLFAERVVSGTRPAAPGLSVTPVAPLGTVTAADAHMSPQIAPAADAPSSVAATLWHCTRSFDLPVFSALSLMRVEQELREATWTRDQAACAESVFLENPPDGCGRPHRVTRVCRHADPSHGILAEVDVLVVGGGTSGAPAAIAAARGGAKTLCIEFAGRLGGVATEGGVGRYCFGLRRGFTSELDASVAKVGSFYSSCKAHWLFAEGRRLGVEYWFCSQAVGAVVERGVLTGVRVVLPDGTCGIVRAKATIDATGYALLAASAGEGTEFLSPEELSVQGAGSAPIRLGHSLINTDGFFVDDTDTADVTYEWLRARSSYSANTWDQSAVVSSRERRRMRGAYAVSVADVMAGRNYPDLISLAYSNFDTHGQAVDSEFFVRIPDRRQMFTARVPYRALLPEKLDGLLSVGLGMSAHRDAMPVLRMQADLQNQGYAAGLAAAQAIRRGCALREIDVRELQKELVAEDILSEEDIAGEANLPASDEAMRDAVASLANDYEGLPVVMSDTSRSLPLLRRAYAQSKAADARLAYAHVLGALGDATGAASLVVAVNAEGWDVGWNYRGMGQYGTSLSRMDSYVNALGCAGNRGNAEVLSALRRKAAALTPESDYSHFRVVARAAWKIGDSAFVPDLERLLALEGVMGHNLEPGALPPLSGFEQEGTHIRAGDTERNDCLRELVLAHALYVLGDPHGLAEGILGAYASDPRRIYASYAKLVKRFDLT